MTESPKDEDRVQRSKPLTEFWGEDSPRAGAKTRLPALEKRGRPFGSPEIDWCAAEQEARPYLLASGIELGPDDNLYR
jgi:Protein of unknown function (DUF2934)